MSATGVMRYAANCVLLLLTACAAVPDSGPVREGLARLEQSELEVRYNPSGPPPGADQETIVRGFMLAASSSTNDYETARAFLAPSYANIWDPWSGVLIDNNVRETERLTDGLIACSLGVVARLDAAGTMFQSDPASTTNVQFELTQVAGEWRISSAPNGIILDRNTFASIWTTRQLYYVSADHRLVPEWRWFLNRDTMTTQLVQGLLGGPSQAMAGATSTAFPAATELTSNTVPIVDGIATINLSTELFDADEQSMELLKRQLASSLQNTVGVTGFQLAVRGSIVDGGDLTPVEESASGEYQYVAVAQSGIFGFVGSNAVQELGNLSRQVSALSPLAVTVTPELSAAAVLHHGGVTWIGGEQRVTVDERRGLLTPSLDPLGYVWTYASSSPDAVWVTHPDDVSPDNMDIRDAPGTPLEGSAEPQAAPEEAATSVFTAPWLAAAEVVALRVSMGGNRLAALLNEDGESVVRVAGIVRDSHGKPIGLTSMETIELWEQGSPIDLDWIGDTRFAALTQAGLLGGSAKVTIGEVSGRFPVSSGLVSGGVSITGGGDRAAMLRVLDEQHRMFGPQGNAGWQLVLSEVDLLAKVG